MGCGVAESAGVENVEPDNRVGERNVLFRLFLLLIFQCSSEELIVIIVGLFMLHYYENRSSTFLLPTVYYWLQTAIHYTHERTTCQVHRHVHYFPVLGLYFTGFIYLIY